MNRKNIYYWLLLPVLALMMGACSESNNNEEPDKPDTPVNPVDPGDWQTVPTAGGTIERGDIALTFPVGTFSSDIKVAITEVKKGEILGEDEASTFYQVTMPVSNKKNITVNIKSSETADDIYVITSVPTIAKHIPNIISYVPISSETTYSNGEYTATLPASQNEGTSEDVTIYIGLGHRAVFSKSSDIGSSRSTRAIEGEKEGKITWYFETDRNFETDNTTALGITVDRVNLFMHEAIKQIDALGFKLLIPTRRIPITLFDKTDKTKDLWGVFEQHYSNDTKSWFSIRKDMLTDINTNQKDVKATIFHELLHYFQADYDQRYPWMKYHDCKSDDLLMYEAGGRWIEKFVYGYLPNHDNRMKNFIKGLIDLEDIYKGDDIGTARQLHGYAMSSLFEYWAQELGDKKIVEIYDEWATHIDGWGWYNDLTINVLKKFASNHDTFVFAGGYDAFILACANGVISPEFDLGKFDEEMGTITTAKNSTVFNGVNYAYGADNKRLFINLNSTESLKDKEIVIKPQTADMDTYIYKEHETKEVKDGKYELLRNDPFTFTDSLVISGDELESARNGNNIKLTYYLLTTHYIDTEKAKNYTIKVELRDAKATITPSEMTFPAEGGTQESKITAPSFSHFGVSVDNAYSSWLSATPAKGGKVMVTAMVNTTSEKRSGYVKCYVAKSADAPESEWVWLTPIKVTQEAGTVMEGWVLVNTEVIKHENTTGDRGQYMNYTASETELSKEGKVIGRVGPYKDVDKLFDLGYVTTIQALPTTLSAGDTLRIHITAKRTTEATIDKDYKNQVAYYDYMAVEMWWNVYNSSGYFGVENLDGPSGGPSSYSTATTSSWDFVYRVPSGSKDKEESIYLTACGSKVIWTYRWGGPSD